MLAQSLCFERRLASADVFSFLLLFAALPFSRLFAALPFSRLFAALPLSLLLLCLLTLPVVVIIVVVIVPVIIPVVVIVVPVVVSLHIVRAVACTAFGPSPDALADSLMGSRRGYPLTAFLVVETAAAVFLVIWHIELLVRTCGLRRGIAGVASGI